MAMSLVSTVTVGSGGAASIEWTGISGAGKDLLVLVSSRDDFGLPYSYFYVYPNGNTSSQTYRTLRARDNSTVNGTNDPPFYHTGDTQTTSLFGNVSVYISNYALSGAKSVSVDSANTGLVSAPRYGIYANFPTAETNPITSLRLTGIGTFRQNTVASLYIIS